MSVCFFISIFYRFTDLHGWMVDESYLDVLNYTKAHEIFSCTP